MTILFEFTSDQLRHPNVVQHRRRHQYARRRRRPLLHGTAVWRDTGRGSAGQSTGWNYLLHLLQESHTGYPVRYGAGHLEHWGRSVVPRQDGTPHGRRHSFQC